MTNFTRNDSQSNTAAGNEQLVSDADRRARRCRELSSQFGIEIRRILRLPSTDRYWLELFDGRVEFSIAQLFQQSVVRLKLAAETGTVIARYKPAVWGQIVQTVLDAAALPSWKPEDGWPPDLD